MHCPIAFTRSGDAGMLISLDQVAAAFVQRTKRTICLYISDRFIVVPGSPRFAAGFHLVQRYGIENPAVDTNRAGIAEIVDWSLLHFRRDRIRIYRVSAFHCFEM